jgi:isopenicillin N synthase-like dioxygenase
MAEVKVPIIDVSNLVKEGASLDEKLVVAREIGQACEEVGFFVIVGHGVPNDVIDNIWSSTREFFDLDDAEKNRYVYPQEEYPFGYSGIGTEILSSGKAAENGAEEKVEHPPDIKEMFSLGPASPAAGFPSRRFPPNPDSFERTWEVYYETLVQLARKILHAFALTLELKDEMFFERFIDHHASALRALNYPSIPVGERILPGQCRASAHTDYGTITILRADGPGLQVSKDVTPPVWCDVPFVPDGFIINLGDLMKRWTNDKWLSTLHRVVVPEEDVVSNQQGLLCRRRQSIAFFHNLNRDASVECLLTQNGETPKYEPIIAGDFLLQKHLAAMGQKSGYK